MGEEGGRDGRQEKKKKKREERGDRGTGGQRDEQVAQTNVAAPRARCARPRGEAGMRGRLHSAARGTGVVEPPHAPVADLPSQSALRACPAPSLLVLGATPSAASSERTAVTAENRAGEGGLKGRGRECRCRLRAEIQC